MKTYVEFYDRTLVENICSSLINPPDRIILIGDNFKALKRNAEICSEILKSHGIQPEIICKSVNKNNMKAVLILLTEIVETDDECTFDITGGDDVMLTAAGIISERYRDKHIQMHRVNIRNNTIQDCDLDGNTVAELSIPELTVSENIRIYGGSLVSDGEKPGATYDWGLSEKSEESEEFIGDINAMWEICKADVRLWNTQIGVFSEALSCDSSKEKTSICAPMRRLEASLKQHGAKYIHIKKICKALQEKGLITSFSVNEEEINISFKNEKVKRCLTKAGQALEMKIYISALKATDKDGLKVYNDVVNGAYIDWDGNVHTEQNGHDTENEVDVIMMHGMIPVFASCKNGYIDMDELYKLNTVANRFAGKYAKKVLIATALDSGSDFSKSFRQRASEMKIRLVENIQKMSDEELNRVIRSLWQN